MRWLVALAVMLLVCSFRVEELRDSCNNFDNENACKGNQTDNDDSWQGRNFQTPPRGDPLWREGYQDYSKLVGYARTIYSSDRRSATVTVLTTLNPRDSDAGSVVLKYFYNDVEGQNKYNVDSNFKSLLKVVVKGYLGDQLWATLTLDELDFIWNHPTVNQPSSYKNGQKGAIIEMFGWPYDQIEKECEMIGKAGYLGVKVFPPMEAILDFEHPENGELNPWYWVYQPVSYRLHSRMGSADDLRKMINTCRKNNVRVYADAVVNHISGNGNDMFPNHCSGGNFWGAKNSSGGSPWYTQGFAYQNWTYTGQRPGMEAPAVPYGPLDFHCARSLNSWTDGFILNYGWLVNLADLNTERDNVRQRIADYFTDLLSIGFSGFRMDAAKHISPANLAAIFAKFKSNLGGSFTDDFVTYLEVIIGGEKDLLMCQPNSYNYGSSFVQEMQKVGLTTDEIYRIKIWESDYPKEFPLCGWPIPSERYVAMLDCHDDQFPGASSRDMGDSGSVLVKERNLDKHRNFEIQLFSRTDGNWQIKLVLSSYTFIDSKGAYGFPDGKSDCERCTTSACRQSCSKSMPYSEASRSDVCGYTCWENGQWKEGAYTRVHRDYKIIKAMRQWMGLSTGSPTEVGLPSFCS